MKIIDGRTYYEDQKGRLISSDMVNECDIIRDKIVGEMISEAKKISTDLSGFKKNAFDVVYAFVEHSNSEYGAKYGGKKGNIQLLSYDGSQRIQISIQDRLSVNEKIVAAKSLIEECLNDWTKESRDEIKIIVQNAFDVSKTGKINPESVLKLRSYKIDDERWKTAMKAISDAIIIEGTSEYIRFYERNEKGMWEGISLDFAKL